MQEPSPYRPPEEVVADWIRFYQHIHPGQRPSLKWLSAMTRLSKTCVSNHLREYFSTRGKNIARKQANE